MTLPNTCFMVFHICCLLLLSFVPVIILVFITKVAYFRLYRIFINDKDYNDDDSESWKLEFSEFLLIVF